MDYADHLRAAATSKNAAVMRFGQRYLRDKSVIFLFFEDLATQALYLPLARDIFGPSAVIMCIPCRNKEDVLRVCKDIRAQYHANRRTLFFIDKDFGDFSGINPVEDSEIYVTDYYSIENHVSVESVISYIINEKMCIDMDDEFKNHIIEQYKCSQRSLYRALRAIMAWAICNAKNCNNVNFQDIDLRHIVEFDDKFLVRKKVGCFREVKKRARNGLHEINFESIRSILVKIKNVEPKIYIRGKYDIAFFVIFIEGIKELVRAQTLPNQRRRYIDCQINKSNIFSYVGGHVSITSLSAFLKLACSRYSGANTAFRKF